jgi:hypothetical protein
LLLSIPTLGILFPALSLLFQSRANESTRSRLALVVLLNTLKSVLLLVVFSSSTVMTTRRLSLPLLTGPPFILLLRWPLFVDGLSQLYVKNTFLHGELHEVYIYSSPSYSVLDGHVCRLRCSLYGLKQAPRAWFERFTSVVIATSFAASQHDPTFFVHTSPRGRTPILLYVDDMLITGDDYEYIAFVKALLSEQFHMSDLVPLSYFLGIEVTSTPNGYYLSQRKYIHDLLDHAGLTNHHSVDTPMEPHTCLHATDDVPLEDPTRYRHLVSSLVYLGITRPDISYVVHILSQFMSTPTSVHYSYLLRVLRYLCGTIDRHLFFSSSSSI